MKSQIKGAAKRLVISLLVAGGLGGCAVYAPPYASYESPYGSYESTYPYGGPAYVYPPVSLDLGFTYYDRGPRYYGGYGGYGGYRGGHYHRGFRHGRR